MPGVTGGPDQRRKSNLATQAKEMLIRLDFPQRVASGGETFLRHVTPCQEEGEETSAIKEDPADSRVQRAGAGRGL